MKSLILLSVDEIAETGFCHAGKMKGGGCDIGRAKKQL